MPYNGSGIFTLVAGNPVVTGTTISSTVHNNTMSDIANNGLTLALTKDGQQTPTGNLPMGGFRHTGVANGVARTDYAALGQAQDSGARDLTNVTGTDTITATLSPAITAYVKGQTFNLVPAGNNTGTAVTININGVGAKSITKNGTLALAPNDLVTGVASQIYYDGTQFQLQTVPGSQNSAGTYSVRGLNGANNTGTPNTKFDFAADAVTLKGTGSRPPVTLYGTGGITNDIAVQGANGRDQVSTFSASTWIHFYYIWNGTTLATLSSLVSPATGPTLPTGYTHWAYIGAVYYNATPLLVKTRMKGCMSYFEFPLVALTGGGATAETPVSLTAIVPPNALSFIVQADTFNMTGDGSGNAFANAFVRFASGFNFSRIARIAISGVASAGQGTGGAAVEMPNVGQQLYYVIQVLNGSAQSLTLNINGYKNPNGGE